MLAPATALIEVTPPSVHTGAWARRLADAPALAPAAAFGVSAGDTVVVAVAHPDDETLAMGAALAGLALEGVLVHVVAMTCGEAALDHVGVHVEGLAERRRDELAAAARALGLEDATALHLPDGALAGSPAQVEDAVAEAIEQHRPRRVATLWRDDPHPDHRAVSAAAASAAAVAGVGVVELGLWSTHWSDPVDAPADIVVLAADEESSRRKRAALACYASQTESLAPGLAPVLPRSVVSWPHEYVVGS